MNKDELKDSLDADISKVRGAMIEILAANREINKDLVDQMVGGDFALLEEYNLLTKGILDASKLLTDIHSQTPKTLKDIQNIKEEKKSINLNDLVDTEGDEDDA